MANYDEMNKRGNELVSTCMMLGNHAANWQTHNVISQADSIHKDWKQAFQNYITWLLNNMN